MQRDISGYVLPMDPRQGPNLSPTRVPTVFGYWVRWATVGCPVDPAVLLDAYSRSATLVEVTPAASPRGLDGDLLPIEGAHLRRILGDML